MDTLMVLALKQRITDIQGQSKAVPKFWDFKFGARNPSSTKRLTIHSLTFYQSP